MATKPDETPSPFDDCTRQEYRVILDIKNGVEVPDAGAVMGALVVGTQDEIAIEHIDVLHVGAHKEDAGSALASLFAGHNDVPEHLTAEHWTKAIGEWRHIVRLLSDAESFLSGFDDCNEEDRPKCLDPIRAALAGNAGAGDAYPLSDREHATVLAALRCYQAEDDGHGNAELHDIATNSGTLDALSITEIDALCERLNSGG